MQVCGLTIRRGKVVCSLSQIACGRISGTKRANETYGLKFYLETINWNWNSTLCLLTKP